MTNTAMTNATINSTAMDNPAISSALTGNAALRTLVLIEQGVLASATLYEAISAVMVLATYGAAVNVAFMGDAVELLRPQHADTSRFKSVSALIESFEFYDLSPVWVVDQAIPSDAQVAAESVRLCDIDFTKFKAVLKW